jgi:transcriptional regulator GlxA family with amidase domain
MDRVIFVTFDGVQTLDVTGPAEVFAAAGRVLGRPVYELVYASSGGGPRITSAQSTLRTVDVARLRPRPRDVVLVAGGEQAPLAAAASDPTLRAWLRRVHARVRIFGSVCSGAFVLAAAGLLAGRRVATHWSACAELARRYPTVHVDADAIFVRDGRTWTSAGVTTGIDMALAIVEEDRGRELADAIAGRLVLYVRRPGFQSQFSDALVAQTGAGDGVARAIAWARAHLAEAGVTTLARHAGMSVRTFHRRCLETLRTTPARVVDRIRVERARAILERRDVALKELAAAAGFASVAQLNRACVRELGLTPREYRLLHGVSAASAGSRREGRPRRTASRSRAAATRRGTRARAG